MGEDYVKMAPKPSALRVAQMRAVHQLLDAPVVFEDPLALKILGPTEEQSLREAPGFYDAPWMRGLRASLAVRSRVAEEAWAAARRRGARQYVILGAGLDTYAYRSAEEDGAKVFEVDLPATQAWKRDLLRTAGIAEPAWVTYVPIDFERATLADALGGAGFRADAPAFFSWLGVTMYLDEAAIEHTLHFIGALAAGSGVVFDYAVDTSLLSPRERMGVQFISTKTAEQGEPWKTFYDPAKLAAKMQALGFREAEDFGAEQLNEQYFAGRTDGLRKSGVTRIMRA